MSDVKHTAEPWFVNLNSIDCPDDKISIEADGDFFIAQVDFCDSQEQNARRIVACVNACEGLSTDELERFGLASAFGTELLEIEKQRNQLLAALEACLSDDFDTPKPNCKTWHIREQAKAAIAAVKGEK